MDTVRPIIVTPDIQNLVGSYTGLLGAEQIFRYQDDGPAFYIGLTIGDSELGLSSDTSVERDSPGPMLLSIDVPDVDALLPRVADLGGSAGGPANDMPWGQRMAHIKDPDGNVVNLTQQL